MAVVGARVRELSRGQPQRRQRNQDRFGRLVDAVGRCSSGSWAGRTDLRPGRNVTGLIADLSYTPPIARQRPTRLEARLRLPPQSTATLLINYESSYLWYTEYPSDAHRGFELPPATVQLLARPEDVTAEGAEAEAGRSRAGLTVHTASTLLSLPTPDFSMPYNVIVLTSTVMALFFGNVMNKLVREWRVVKLEEEGEEDGDGQGEEGEGK